MKRKWWVFARPPYSPQGNGRHLPRIEPRGEEIRGADIVRGWEDKRDHDRILDTSVGPPNPSPNNVTQSPHTPYLRKIN